MRTLGRISLSMAITLAATDAFAQVGKPVTIKDANLATEQELLAVPHLTPALVKQLIGKRPFGRVTELDALLAPTLTRAQRTEIYRRIFVHLNLNAFTDQEALLIPGVGPRALREFKEYRPYKALAHFEREMRKYWDSTEVARLAQYAFVPIDLNTASDDAILSIPGAGRRTLHEFKEYRPYRAIAQFRREMRKYWSAKEVARLERFVVVR